MLMHLALPTFLTCLRRVNRAERSVLFFLYFGLFFPLLDPAIRKPDLLSSVVTCCSHSPSPPPPTNPQPLWRLREMGGILEGSSRFLF